MNRTREQWMETIRGLSSTHRQLASEILSAIEAGRRAERERCFRLACEFCAKDTPVERAPEQYRKLMSWWHPSIERICNAKDIREGLFVDSPATPQGAEECEGCKMGLKREGRAGCEGVYYVHYNPRGWDKYEQWPLCTAVTP